MKKNKFGIYIHIPFCESKCYYCDFNSSFAEEDKIKTYIDNLIKEMNLYSKNGYFNRKVDTIFIGGGTPSFIDSKHISNIIDALNRNFDLSELVEFTIECNPNSIDEKKIDDYVKGGINRISLGLQSTNDFILKKIGRKHTYDIFTNAYNMIKLRLDNISVDLIIGLPYQTLNDVKKDLDSIIELNPMHISIYSLKLEENTVLYNQVESGKISIPDDELEREMYHYAIRILKDNGYNQYEISNFSKKNFESKHNLIYWERDEYLGLGVSSSSLISEKRFNNIADIDKYIFKIESGEFPTESIDEISMDEALFEKIILGLRLNRGLNIDRINLEFDINFREKYRKNIDKLLKQKLIYIKNNTMYLTDLGIDISNKVFLEFIPS